MPATASWTWPPDPGRAHDLGLVADRTRPRFVQLGIDAVDVPAVRAFWTAVLGYEHDPRSS